MSENRIKITRNPLTLGLRFVGVRTNTEDPFGPRFVGIASGNDISVLNENLTVGSGVSIYTLRDVPYTRFMDSDGNDFANVDDALNYINLRSSDGITVLPESKVATAITVSAGVGFTYTADFKKRSSYFWDESTVPTGLSVSAFDNRKLSGTVSNTGIYNVVLEVANYFGITTSTISIDVV